jgi:hypothetical protein
MSWREVDVDAHAAQQLYTESDRQQLIEELKAKHGENWAAGYKPGTFGCHELLDRVSLLANTLEDALLTHPALAQNATWYALASQAATALQELYQRVGAEHLGAKNDDP